jgi:nucleotide-binding universal stress UspA family protein
MSSVDGGDTGSAFELGTDGPRSIVVGVDGSPASLRAGAYAAGIARRERSRLTVVFARGLGATAATAYDPTGASLSAHTGKMDYVQQQLVDQLERSAWAVDAHLEVRVGDPVSVISSVAEEVRAELVVVGGSRHLGFPLTRAVGVQLMRKGRYPVVVVP